jgi:hypothetical protein
LNRHFFKKKTYKWPTVIKRCSVINRQGNANETHLMPVKVAVVEKGRKKNKQKRRTVGEGMEKVNFPLSDPSLVHVGF